MITLAQDILTHHVPERSIAVFFAGQAGYILKSPDGILVAVDLYLSDCCSRLAGFKRLMPRLLDACDIAFDVIICTHEHPDHLDVDVMPAMATHGSPVVYVNKEGAEIMARFDITNNIKVMETGGIYTEGSLKIEAVYCDHGTSAPNAVGLILTLNSKTVNIAGDTAYRPEMISDIASREIDLMAAPINGAYGNLNEEEAVMLCGIVKPKLMTPCHYWNFAEHGGSLQIFMMKMKELLPGQAYIVMRMGEGIII
jgi:L-ascorbate 6-phosphate lactonase